MNLQPEKEEELKLKAEQQTVQVVRIVGMLFSLLILISGCILLWLWFYVRHARAFFGYTHDDLSVSHCERAMTPTPTNL